MNYPTRFLIFSVLFATHAYAQVPSGFFTDVINVGQDIDLNTYDFLPTVSDSGLTLFFSDSEVPGQGVNFRPGGEGGEDMWMATRANTNEPFTNAVNLDMINSSSNDDMGSVGSDGALYFGSDRSGNWDVYAATRSAANGPYDTVTALGSGINSDNVENSPRITPDGTTMVFHRRPNESGTPRDIWIATRTQTDQPFSDAVRLPDAVNEFHENFPSISSDGLTIFYSDWDLDRQLRPGKGGWDIWVTTRASTADEFGTPIGINELFPGTSINGPGFEGAPFISPDWPALGSKLYYVAEGNGLVDIFQATWVPEPSGGTLMLAALFCLPFLAQNWRGTCFSLVEGELGTGVFFGQSRQSADNRLRIAQTFSVVLLLSMRVGAQAPAQFLTDDLTPIEVASGFAFTEGPSPDGAGGIWFSDIDRTDIHRFDIATGTTTLVNGDSGGSNGLVFDDQGRLLAAEQNNQRLTRTDGDNIEVLADMWNGKRLNSPNDIVIDSSGGIYFTDPAYANNVQREAVYYISPNGTMTQVISNLSRPNGIALSPDETTLYVAEPTSNPFSGNANMKIWEYDLAAPGLPENPMVFADTFADGLTVDVFGNVFAATYFGFGAWTPDGDLIFQETSPSATTNVVFENPAGTYPNTLYITAGGSLYRTDIFPVPEPNCSTLLLLGLLACFRQTNGG